MDSEASNNRNLAYEGFKNYISNSINYNLFTAIVLLMVICASLYNLTHQVGDQQLWRDLLLLSFGIAIPSQSNKQKPE